MKKQLLLFICSLPGLLVAQQKVTFPDDFKTNALNGKEVTITNTLTLANNYSYDAGTLTLSDGQLWTPTEKNMPGVEMFTQKNKENQDNQLTLKQGSYSFVDANKTCRIGQTITGVTGTAAYSNGKYTITLTKKPEFTGNERPTACTTDKQYNLKVVSFNLELFNKNSTKYDFQIKCKKVSLVLQALQADVYALVEVEGAAGLEALCTMLNEALSTKKYKTRYSEDYKNGMACFIYDSEKVTPVAAITQNKLADNYLPERKIAQGFQLNSNQERFILCCNHWKSKAGNPSGIYLDKGDGQGAFNARRVQEAEATLNFIEEIKTIYNDPDVLVVGDLNAYTAEDPIRILEEGGLRNLLTMHAPNEYSYAFFINNSYTTGYLDHSLATPSLEAQTAIARPFRINADEPGKLDMDKAGLQKDNMYRCSDHNPIVTFFNLGDNTTGIENAGMASSHPTIRISGDPQSGYLTLTSNTEFALHRAEIIAISGQVVATFTAAEHSGNNSLQLSIKGLARGFYMVRAYDMQGLCATSKVVLP